MTRAEGKRLAARQVETQRSSRLLFWKTQKWAFKHLKDWYLMERQELSFVILDGLTLKGVKFRKKWKKLKENISNYYNCPIIQLNSNKCEFWCMVFSCWSKALNNSAWITTCLTSTLLKQVCTDIRWAASSFSIYLLLDASFAPFECGVYKPGFDPGEFCLLRFFLRHRITFSLIPGLGEWLVPRHSFYWFALSVLLTSTVHRLSFALDAPEQKVLSMEWSWL